MARKPDDINLKKVGKCSWNQRRQANYLDPGLELESHVQLSDIY
jgi:hypothetical protein